MTLKCLHEHFSERSCWFTPVLFQIDRTLNTPLISFPTAIVRCTLEKMEEDYMLESKMSRFIVITSGSYLKSKHLVPLLLPSSGFYACAKKLALELLGRCPLGSFAKDGKWIGVTFLQPKWFWGRCVRVLVKCSFW